MPRIKIFAVDDEPIFLEMLQDVLTVSPNLEVYTFQTGEDCLSRLALKPDIIVLDHILNKSKPEEKTGLELIKTIKSKVPNCEIIVLSGQKYPTVIFDYIMNNEVNRYIVKHENALNELNEAIVEILQSKFGMTL